MEGMETLLEDIAGFIQAHDMSERRFGELALNDTRFLWGLRNGRSPSLRTVDKLRRFMAAYPNHERQAA